MLLKDHNSCKKHDNRLLKEEKEMRLLVVFLIVFLIIGSIVISIGVGIGFVLSKIIPDLGIGMGIVAGAIFSIEIIKLFIRLLSAFREEIEDSNEREDSEYDEPYVALHQAFIKTSKSIKRARKKRLNAANSADSKNRSAV